MGNEHKEELKTWLADEALAIQAIGPIHKLWVEASVEILLFRRALINRGPVDILKYFQYARQISQVDFGIADSLPVIEALTEIPLCPSRIDIGRLTIEWMDADHSKIDLKSFLKQQLADHLDPNACRFEPRDVVLYGFGRIGRLMARILIEQAGGGDALKLRAIVTRGKPDIEKRANLLLRDSVHGSLQGNIRVLPEEGAIVANGSFIKFISSDAPETVDYESYGIHNALIIDNTGVWRDREALERHLKAKGAERVLLTAPGKGDIPNIVYGVNTRAWPEDEKIFSAASCTTNAIVPPLKILNDVFGINYAHVETVHAYTNDQNLLDNYHMKKRRGRSAALNMVLTETGAATAIAKALPELTGKITGSAVRVPTPDVSLAVLNLDLRTNVKREDVNEALRKASLYGPMVAQMDYTRDQEIVSSDMVGNTHSSIVDSLATVTHDNRATVYCWYDNEYGYAMQVSRLARIISGVERLRYY